jgi:hypothetical protein
LNAAWLAAAAAGGATVVTGSSGSDGNSGSSSAGPTGHGVSGVGTGSAFSVTVTVVQCIRSGIASDAASTTSQVVM